MLMKLYENHYEIDNMIIYSQKNGKILLSTTGDYKLEKINLDFKELRNTPLNLLYSKTLEVMNNYTNFNVLGPLYFNICYTVIIITAHMKKILTEDKALGDSVILI